MMKFIWRVWVGGLLYHAHSEKYPHLWLSDNEITTTEIQLLATAIGYKNSKHELLSFVENPFGDECFIVIATMLERNRSLRSLNVSKTNLSLRSEARLKKIASIDENFVKTIIH